MTQRDTAPNSDLIRVGVADVAVTENGATLATSGLGSCVAIGLYDASEGGVGGLLHAMLPEAPADTENRAKYVDTGVADLIAGIEDAGGDAGALVAKFAGGSAMLNIGTAGGIGAKNVAATESALEALGIDVLGSDTGGDSGRSVRFHPQSGDYTIERVDTDPRTL